jgi:hypothetical protein
VSERRRGEEARRVAGAQRTRWGAARGAGHPDNGAGARAARGRRCERRAGVERRGERGRSEETGVIRTSEWVGSVRPSERVGGSVGRGRTPVIYHYRFI